MLMSPEMSDEATECKKEFGVRGWANAVENVLLWAPGITAHYTLALRAFSTKSWSRLELRYFLFADGGVRRPGPERRTHGIWLVLEVRRLALYKDCRVSSSIPISLLTLASCGSGDSLSRTLKGRGPSRPACGRSAPAFGPHVGFWCFPSERQAAQSGNPAVQMG